MEKLGKTRKNSEKLGKSWKNSEKLENEKQEVDQEMQSIKQKDQESNDDVGTLTEESPPKFSSPESQNIMKIPTFNLLQSPSKTSGMDHQSDKDFKSPDQDSVVNLNKIQEKPEYDELEVLEKEAELAKDNVVANLQRVHLYIETFSRTTDKIAEVKKRRLIE